MILNIQVEIGWLSEEGNLDKDVKDEIVNRVVESVSTKVIGEVTDASIGKIGEQIDALVAATFDEIMNREIMITDQWGDPRKAYKSTKDMIKDRFDGFLFEKVNDSGQASSYGDATRFDYIVKRHLRNLSEKWTKEAVAEVTQKIKEILSDDLKASFGERVLGMLDLDSLLKTMKK
jgi:hypothetical protein